MKTTIDISDALALEAKALAARRDTTFREIVERGIRHTLQEAQQVQTFQLVDKSVTGHGLQAEFRDRPWAAIRHSAYEGRGS
ncbi:MAG: hypothetical protein OXD47_12105 [Gammaproteobacteria bacterium]|nr:hypothetical protein [Gammaproteobacteria bacterium]MCY4210662.1 hypothetical protein [Gammaproteobacteria bacterium]MCY4282558.1 hypothetical protein [Gammaproteobacteria bacterium]MCY4339513.1 hypothetical protein [Gammaproteobacteria bacterium]